MGNQDKYLRSRSELAQSLNGTVSRKSTAPSDEVRQREMKLEAEQLAERKRLAALLISGTRVKMPDGRHGVVVQSNRKKGTVYVKPDGIRSNEPFAATQLTKLNP